MLEPQVNTVQYMGTHGEPVTFNDTVRAPVGAFVRGVIAPPCWPPGAALPPTAAGCAAVRLRYAAPHGARDSIKHARLH